jgi:hypothetical protein
MADLWYYTCEGKERPPVSLTELKRLAETGALRPTDMVWTDGMPRWARASVATEFFPEGTSRLEEPAPLPVVLAPIQEEALPAPKRDRRRREEADERDLPRRRPSGALIALGVGAAVVFSAMLLGAGALLFRHTSLQQPALPIENNFPDVDLTIKDQAGNKMKEDTSFGPDCFIESWSPPSTGEYNVVVQDLDIPGFPARSTVTIRELSSRTAVVPPYTVVLQVNEKSIRKIRFQKDKQYEFTVKSVIAPAVPLNPLPLEPPPAGVLGLPANVDFTGLKPGAEQIIKIQVPAATRAKIRIVGLRVKAGTNLNLFVLRDRDNALIAQDVRQNAVDRIFLLDALSPTTEIYRVRIVNAGTALAEGSVFFTKQ